MFQSATSKHFDVVTYQNYTFFRCKLFCTTPSSKHITWHKSHVGSDPNVQFLRIHYSRIHNIHTYIYIYILRIRGRIKATNLPQQHCKFVTNNVITFASRVNAHHRLAPLTPLSDSSTKHAHTHTPKHFHVFLYIRTSIRIRVSVAKRFSAKGLRVCLLKCTHRT